jgi:salicylate hydroxylase
VLAELLADRRVGRDTLETVFSTFDAERRRRCQWLVQSSRRVGDCYEWRAEGVGRDFDKIEAEINERNGIIANVDVPEMCRRARDELARRLG